MLESKYIYFCDSCFVEKDGVRGDIDPESVNSCVYRKPFSCVKKEQWNRHINTIKHITNVTMYNNFKDECINECRHCKVRLDKRSYIIHMNRNSKYHLSKHMDYAKESSCNNFILDGRRFNSIEIVRAYYDNKLKYSYGKDNKLNYTKKNFDLALKIIDDKADHEIKLNESRKEKERKQLEEFNKKKEEREAKERDMLKKKKNKSVKLDIPNLEMTIEESDKELVEKINEKYPTKYENESPVQKAQRERKDINIPPEIDPDDLCEECGYTRNEYLVYPIEKLERYDIPLCSCEETDSDEDI